MSNAEGFARIDDATFPEQLRQARKRLSVSQEALTEGLADRGYVVHVTAIGKIERRERKVTIGEAAAIADVLGVSLDSLVGAQQNLQSAYTKQATARSALERALEEYSAAVMEVAMVADQVPDLPSRDETWLSETLLVDQTPSQISSVASVFLDARVSYESITPGAHLAALMKAIRSDADALHRVAIERRRSGDH